MNAITRQPLLAASRQVWKTYGEGEARVKALASVGLSIERGDFVAIMGPSGSGKSTAMNIIDNLDTPSAMTTTCSKASMPIRLDRNSRALLGNHYIDFVFRAITFCRAPPPPKTSSCR